MVSRSIAAFGSAAMLVFSGPLFAQDAAGADAGEQGDLASYYRLAAELYYEEVDPWRDFYATLPQPQRDVLLDLSDRLPEGDRGIFAAAILSQDAAGRAAMVDFLEFIGPDLRQGLADKIVSHHPRRWSTISAYLQHASPGEVAWAMFRAEPAPGCPYPPYPGPDGEANAAVIGDDNLDPSAAAVVEDCSDATFAFMQDWNQRRARVTSSLAAPAGEVPWQAELIWSTELITRYLTPDRWRRDKEAFGVKLEFWEHQHFCGGVYIGDGWALTAAHCIDTDPDANFIDAVRIRLGQQDAGAPAYEYPVRAVVIPAEYVGKADNFRNDIALLQIGAPVDGRGVLAATVPRSSSRASGIAPETPLTLTGWGRTGSAERSDNIRADNGVVQRYARYLQYGEMAYRNTSTCSSRGRLAGVAIRSGQLCAGSDEGVGSCRGDSGGPLVLGRPDEVLDRTRPPELIGLVSFSNGCGMPDTPTVFVDVGAYRGWIDRAKRKAKRGTIARLAVAP